MEQALLELLEKTALRTGDYAGTLGFCRGTFNLILQNAKEEDYERIEELSHKALEMIEDIFIKHQVK